MEGKNVKGLLIEAANLLSCAVSRMPVEFSDKAAEWSARVQEELDRPNVTMLLGISTEGDVLSMRIGCEDLFVPMAAAVELGNAIAHVASGKSPLEIPIKDGNVRICGCDACQKHMTKASL